MTAKGLIDYWLTSATRDFEVAQDLFRLARYNYCLFFCHLAIEKLLKGLIFKLTNEHALPIHDIKKLSKQAEIVILDLNDKDLEEITSWNIEARYDSYKQKFYGKATKDFTEKWFKKAKEIFVWLKNQY